MFVTRDSVVWDKLNIYIDIAHLVHLSTLVWRLRLSLYKHFTLYTNTDTHRDTYTQTYGIVHHAFVKYYMTYIHGSMYVQTQTQLRTYIFKSSCFKWRWIHSWVQIYLCVGLHLDLIKNLALQYIVYTFLLFEILTLNQLLSAKKSSAHASTCTHTLTHTPIYIYIYIYIYVSVCVWIYACVSMCV